MKLKVDLKDPFYTKDFGGICVAPPLYLWYYAIVASIFLGLRVLGQAASPLWSLVLTASTVTAMYH